MHLSPRLFYELLHSLPAKLGLLFTVVTILNTFYKDYQSKRRDKIAKTFEFLNEWRKDDMIRARAFVYESIVPKLTPSVAANGFIGLPEEDRQTVRKLTLFLDYVGSALAMGFLHEGLLLTEMGAAAESQWHVLGHLVKGERILREEMDTRAREMKDPNWIDNDAEFETQYLAGFEHLANCANQFKKREALHLSAYEGALTPLLPEGSGDSVALPHTATN